MAELIEHGEAVLLQDRPDAGLRAGDVGCVVMIYENGAAYEVEFVTKDGDTRAVLTLEREAVRPAAPNDMPHVRSLA